MSEPEYLSLARDAYDQTVARFVEAIGTEVNTQFKAPLDRAVLAAFAEHLVADDPGLVLDAGCGPGRITTPLEELSAVWAELDRVLRTSGRH